MIAGRLGDDVPARGEAFHQLVAMGGTRVEHILSSASPDTAPQQQLWDEWVLVLAGAAVLEVQGTAVQLTAGDWLLIPAGTAHRVLRTEAGTSWLAVHAGDRATAQR